MKKLLFLFLSVLTVIIVTSCKEEEPAVEPEPYYPPMLNQSVVDLSKVITVKPYGETIALRVRRSAIRYIVSDALAQVKSVSVGIIDSVSYNSDPNYADYRVRIRASKNSLWYVIYNHVAQVKVKTGDIVVAGTVLGSVGTGNLVDLQTNKITFESSGVKYESTVCPTGLFHGTVTAAHDQMISRLSVSSQLCSYGSVLPYYSEPWR
jgi:hypothetical protein